MTKLRRFAVLTAGALTAFSAYASCPDIRANCTKTLNLDLAYCNKQDARSQDNCYARAHETFLSCVGSCK